MLTGLLAPVEPSRERAGAEASGGEASKGGMSGRGRRMTWEGDTACDMWRRVDEGECGCDSERRVEVGGGSEI